MSAIEKSDVRFGKIARTIICDDENGALLFCFDVAPSTDATKKKWTVYLGQRATEEEGTELLPPSRRVEAAFERVKAYLVKCGYEVEIDG